MTSLFRSILSFIYNFVGNYGWAVIIFSIAIKCVLLPLDIKSRKGMRAMALLNPKMEELKKRYGNDQEKLNQKMSDLYKKNKVNPLSGCLPMLIQLPILYIMFAAMRNAAAEMQLNQVFNWLNQSNILDADGAFLSIDTDAVQAFLANIRTGDAMRFFSGESWLWVKNVFQPDTFGRTVIPTMQELAATLRQYSDALDADKMALLNAYIQNADLSAAVDAAVREGCGYVNYPLFMNLTSINFPSVWNTYVNGICALPILAAGTQVLSTVLQPASEQAANNSNGSGKFMKWFFPLLSLWICWSSNAAFAIYWVFVNVWGIFTTFLINFYLTRQDKKSVDTPTKEELNP